MVADNAHKENKWVGICGELAADTELTDFYLAIRIDELSMSPSRILAVREVVRS
jgi:phosphotransferase system enzyme I (PtsI)